MTRKSSKMETGSNGTKIWKNSKGEYHRLDGPAVIYADGSQSWWVNNKLHRLDGPAVIYPTGRQEWWVNGKQHRLDGPAVIRSNGTKEWYVNGIQISPHLFMRF